MTLSDFVRAGNQAGDPALYEVENLALDRRGLVLSAMRTFAPWREKVLVDLGCGSGFWFRHYVDAATVIGVEPDETLIPLARKRDENVEVMLGSAEHIPLPDASADVVHARFAYFWGEGCERGLEEVARVLAPGGRLVVVDNDESHGEFAELLTSAYPRREPEKWWAERGAEIERVLSDWSFDSRRDLEAVLRLECPRPVADAWLASNLGRTEISYGYLVVCWTRP